MAKKRAKKGKTESRKERIPPKPKPDAISQDIAISRSANQSPEDVFFLNLLTLMRLIGLSTKEELADSLSLHGEDRKWLYRLFKSGLKRPDARKMPLLQRLAQKLMCEVDDLWKPDFDFNPFQLKDHQQLWLNLVRSVRDWIQMWEIVKRKSPKEAGQLVSQHSGGEQTLLADWIAVQHGAARPDLNREELLTLIDTHVRSVGDDEWDWQWFIQMDSFDEDYPTVSSYVLDHAKEHARWPEFEQAYLEPLYEHIRRHKERLGRDDANEISSDEWWMTWVEFLKPLTTRNPTHEEVFEQFSRHYLDRDTPEQTSYESGLTYIMGILTDHPNWLAFVQRRNDDDLTPAEELVSDKWRETIFKYGPSKVSPEKFALFIVNHFLNAVSMSEDDANRKAKSRRTKPIPKDEKKNDE